MSGLVRSSAAVRTPTGSSRTVRLLLPRVSRRKNGRRFQSAVTRKPGDWTGGMTVFQLIASHEQAYLRKYQREGGKACMLCSTKRNTRLW